jgi:hypothetical protein
MFWDEITVLAGGPVARVSWDRERTLIFVIYANGQEEAKVLPIHGPGL